MPAAGRDHIYIMYKYINYILYKQVLIYIYIYISLSQLVPIIIFPLIELVSERGYVWVAVVT